MIYDRDKEKELKNMRHSLIAVRPPPASQETSVEWIFFTEKLLISTAKIDGLVLPRNETLGSDHGVMLPELRGDLHVRERELLATYWSESTKSSR